MKPLYTVPLDDKGERKILIMKSGNSLITQVIKGSDIERSIRRGAWWLDEKTALKALDELRAVMPDLTLEHFSKVLQAVRKADLDASFKPERTNECMITDKEITDRILADHLFYCDKSNDNLPLYVWDNGVWRNGISDGVIIHDLGEIFQDEENRFGMAKDRTVLFIKSQAMDTQVEPQPLNLISFKNGVLDVKTMEFKQHNPQHLCVNLIPHEYITDAKCPKWLEFIEQITYPEDRDFLQEWIGYNLYRFAVEAKFLILTGSGQNGKSLFLETIMKVLGDENVSNVSLHSLVYDPFERVTIHNKLAVISEELGNKPIENVNILMSISAGGRITLQGKYQLPFDARPYCKLSWACNEPPELKDNTEATRFRLEFVKFPYTFSKTPEGDEKLAKDRRELEKEFLAEMPGILNWAIAGLRRLMVCNFKFSQTKSGGDQWSEYKRASRPTFEFADECLDHTDNELDKIPKDFMRKTFQAWLKFRGVKRRVSSDKFFRDMKELDILAVLDREYGCRVYKGVRFTKFVSTFQRSLYPKQLRKGCVKGSVGKGIEGKDGAKQVRLDVVTLKQSEIIKHILGLAPGKYPEIKLADDLHTEIARVHKAVVHLINRGKVTHDPKSNMIEVLGG